MKCHTLLILIESVVLQIYTMKQSASKLWLSTASKNIHHYMSHHLLSLSEKIPFDWKVPQYLSSFPDHNIVIVTITNAQNISSYTVASAGQRELLYCLIQFVPADKKSDKQGSKAWVGCVLTGSLCPFCFCCTTCKTTKLTHIVMRQFLHSYIFHRSVPVAD